MATDNRLKIMLAIAVVAIASVFSLDPIPQNPAYHNFADQRGIIDIANFFNVLSNVPFVIIGYRGMRLASLDPARGWAMNLIFFAGVFLTGFGSAYYHFQPNNQTLLWDRLPMTVAFMALFSTIVGDYISAQLAQKIVVPLLLLGIASVLYWYVTEKGGHGDLRLYVLVQFLPIVLIPLILWQFGFSADNSNYVWGIIGAYAISKLFELFDAEIYGVLGWLSGHSLKHLAAAFGALIYYWAIRAKSA